MSVREALATLVAGGSLSREEARNAMRALVQGEATPAQIGAFAIALRMHGETADEIAGMAEAMREASTRVDAGPNVMDLVGTGGDSCGTFNISTLSAFVVASAGGLVAKHGNRGITSGCGSADILEALGMAIDLPPQGVVACVQESGFGFMLAPQYHPALRHAIGPRREIGVRTVFNILGPLANPALAPRQVTGVAVPEQCAILADVLTLLGAQHALVVHGDDGVDEISISGPTTVHETRGGQRSSYRLTPEDVGLRRAPLQDIVGGTVDTNMVLAQAVLSGQPGAPRDAVLLNAAAGLYVAGLAASIQEGVRRAADEIDSGRVSRKVKQAAEVSQRVKASGQMEAPT